MKLPFQLTLSCPPFGDQPVNFDRADDDESEFEFGIGSISQEIAALACREVLVHWNSTWDSARQHIEATLEDYDYDKSLQELLEDPKNSLNVTVMPPENDERYRLDICLSVGSVGSETGSPVFGVEFVELMAVGSDATF